MMSKIYDLQGQTTNPDELTGEGMMSSQGRLASTSSHLSTAHTLLFL